MKGRWQVNYGGWKLADWVKKNPGKAAKIAKVKLEEQYRIKLKYSEVWSGSHLAMDQVHGKYKDRFQLLFNWAAELVKKSPGLLLQK
jgi:hypothetical protein